MVLASYLAKLFNQSEVVGNTFNHPRSLHYFRVLVFYGDVNSVGGSGKLFQPLEMSRYSLLTCYGRRRDTTNFEDYVAPFQTSLWLSLIPFLFLIVIALKLILAPLAYGDSIWLIIISFLLEHSLPISSSLERKSQFRLIFLLFLIMGIILSNGYKGIVTTSVIMPFNVRGIESLDKIINGKFTIYYEPEHEGKGYHDNCCKNISGLTPFWKNEILVYMATGYPFSLLYSSLGMFNLSRRVEFLDKLESVGGRIRDMNVTSIFGINGTAAADMRKMRFAQLMEPPPCPKLPQNNSVDGAMLSLLECNKTTYILPKIEMDELLLTAQLNPQLYKGLLYKIPDKELENLFPNAMVGLQVDCEHFLTNLFSISASVFAESGVLQNLQSQHKWNRTQMLITQARANTSLEKVLTLYPQKLTMDSKVATTFILYTICASITFVVISIEICITLVQKYLHERREKRRKPHAAIAHFFQSLISTFEG